MRINNGNAWLLEMQNKVPRLEMTVSCDYGTFNTYNKLLVDPNTIVIFCHGKPHNLNLRVLKILSYGAIL